MRPEMSDMFQLRLGRFPYPTGFKTTYLFIPIRVQNLTRETCGSNSDARTKRPDDDETNDDALTFSERWTL
jgi:hypothetical protein